MSSYFSILIQKWLGAKEITCKNGFDRLRNGGFPEELKETIKECADVIIIITADTWERSDDEARWMTEEIELAISFNKNIIPVVIEDNVWYENKQMKVKINYEF